jgi:hypothetical protein
MTKVDKREVFSIEYAENTQTQHGFPNTEQDQRSLNNLDIEYSIQFFSPVEY